MGGLGRQAQDTQKPALRTPAGVRNPLGEPRGVGRLPHPVRGTAWGNTLTLRGFDAIMEAMEGGGIMGKIRATNHHGRSKASKPSSPRHIDRNKLKEAKHIDPEKTPLNRYWTWRGKWQEPGDCEAAERAYYREAFAAGQEAQNERYRRKGNHSRVRTPDQVYENSTTSPEGSLLYIGSLRDGLVDPADLWACALEYREWEEAESEARGGFYKPLTLALHRDEEGQYHVEEHGVYQYRDGAGNLRPGQNAALEAAGFELPDPSQPRSRQNNRKMSWDAVRREKWMDILEAHGYDIERTPEAARPHLGLEAWQAYQDAQADIVTQQASLNAQAAKQATMQAALDAQAAKQAAISQHQITAHNKLSKEQQRQAQESQELEKTKADTQKWAAGLEAWRDAEKAKLAAEAALDTPKTKTRLDNAILEKLKAQPGVNGFATLYDFVADTVKQERRQQLTPPPKPPKTTQDAIEAAKAAAEAVKERERLNRQNGLDYGF